MPADLRHYSCLSSLLLSGFSGGRSFALWCDGAFSVPLWDCHENASPYKRVLQGLSGVPGTQAQRPVVPHKKCSASLIKRFHLHIFNVVMLLITLLTCAVATASQETSSVIVYLSFHGEWFNLTMWVHFFWKLLRGFCLKWWRLGGEWIGPRNKHRLKFLNKSNLP